MTYTSTQYLQRLTIAYLPGILKAHRRAAWTRILPVSLAASHSIAQAVIHHNGTAY